jgi:hypothetical protein
MRVATCTLSAKLRVMVQEQPISSDISHSEEQRDVHLFTMCIIHYLNLLFGNSEASIEYWQDELKRELRSRYEHVLNEGEASESFDLRAYLKKAGLIGWLFTKLCIKNGLQFSQEIQEQAASGYRNQIAKDDDALSAAASTPTSSASSGNAQGQRLFEKEEPFYEEDLLSIQPTYKLTHVVPFVETLKELGRYEEAESLYRQQLAIR